MLFEVISEIWVFRPRRCSMVTYRRGQRGYLPEKDVRKGVEEGHLRIIEEVASGSVPTSQESNP